MTQLIKESQVETIFVATHLIDSSGNVLNKKGTIDLKRGITDDNGTDYVGAISDTGKIYSYIPDFNTVVINMDNPSLPDIFDKK